MKNKYLVLLTTALLLNLALNGCYSFKTIENENYQNEEIQQIVTISGDTLDFSIYSVNRNKIAEVTSDSVIYNSKIEKRVAVSRNEIKQIDVNVYNGSKTTGAIIGASFGLLCSFILLFDLHKLAK